MSNEIDELQQAREEFLAEVREGMVTISAALMTLEGSPHDHTAAKNLFRVVHTIKGNAAFFGFSAIERLCHAMEEPLSVIRNDASMLTTSLASVLLRCNDTLGGLLGELRENGAFTAQVEGLINTLAGQGALPSPSQIPAETPTPETCSETIEPEPVAGAIPGLTEIPGPILAETGFGAAGARDNTIRVSTPLLDNLMNLVGELVLTRNQLLQQSQTQPGSFSNDYIQRLNAITTALQENILKTRMQPVAQVFSTIPRQVRELCLALGKECRVDFQGGETELDRTLLEGLKDALTHLVRNALDHGIESPAEREAKGKPARGTLCLRAYHEGGRVHLLVQDDGSGIHLETLKAQALRQNLLSEAQLSRMDHNQLMELIFHPGFSTREQTSNISGRGVGMDVVKARIESLGGTVTLVSVPEKGLSAHLTLPLTLAILPAVMIQNGNEVMAIPQASVKEVVHFTEANFQSMVRQVSGGHMLRLRGRLLPLYTLQGLLGGAELLTPGMYGLVLDTAGRVLVVAVDRVMDTEEIVVKPLSRELGALGVYSGGTIRGGGEAALILDPAGLTKRANLHEETTLENEKDEAETIPEETEALLLLRQGSVTLAVRLSDVARLENVEASAIQQGAGRRLMTYRGQLMNLVMAQDWLPLAPVVNPDQWPVVVMNQSPPMGLCVQEILDAVAVPRIKSTDTPVEGVETEVLVNGMAERLLSSEKLSEWGGKRAVSVKTPDHAAPQKIKKEKQAAPVSDVQKKRILVVDDSKTIRSLLKTRLESEGYAVDLAEDGVTGLEKLETGQPDLVISDVNMPNMDGIAFVNQIRQQEKPGDHLTVIAVTNERDEDTVRLGIEAGFDNYLFKLNMDEVIHTLEARFRQMLEESAP